MKYAMHADESDTGRLFDARNGCEVFSQRLVQFDRNAAERGNQDSDEVLYVLEGAAHASIDGHGHDLRPGTAVFVARGTSWSVDGEASAVSVLIHHPEQSAASHAVLDLAHSERDDATAGRQFILGATPDSGCASVTQFIGLIPIGRAPDHFHTYDEVIYVLDGEGYLEIGGEQAPVRAGSCIHLPARLVHCLANNGETEMRVLGVFRPAGSPAEAYYPDGTPAVVQTED